VTSDEVAAVVVVEAAVGEVPEELAGEVLAEGAVAVRSLASRAAQKSLL
jgi:hypothetical protein